MNHPAASAAETRPPELESFSTLFDFLPIGAYRSTSGGRQLRANPALVRMNGYAGEAELLAAVNDIAAEWYVDPGRRRQFIEQLERDGRISGFDSEVHRHKTRERMWVRENAHVVRDAAGQVLFYEGTVEEITDRVAADAALERSGALLHDLTARMPGVVFQLHVAADDTRRYDFISDGIRSLYGVEPEAVLADGTLLKRFRHPDDYGRVKAEMDAAAGQPLSVEYRIVTGDGTVEWVHLVSAPAPSAGSKEIRTGMMLDITARKRAEAALHARDAQWKLALESTGDGVWDWNLQTGEKTLSERCKEIYGFAPDELDEQDPIDRRTHADDFPQVLRARDAHFAGLTPTFVNERRVMCKDGRWKWILSRGMVISRDADGRPLRMIGTHTDISERKQADALRLERDHAEAASRSTTQFLSRVSHELRTPLNAILGFAQLLDLDPGAGAKQRGWVTQILASGRHLLGLVDDVLDLSSVQTGQLAFACVDLDLAAVVRETWTMHSAAALAAGIEFVDALPRTLPKVHADRKRMKQVVSNLLSNAIKYNLAGGRITVEAAPRGDEVELLVRDNGRGMSADQLALMFKPFERLGAQRSAVAGTGLGLALSKQLIEAMGGQIRAESVAGVGSTFTVLVPAAGSNRAAPVKPART